MNKNNKFTLKQLGWNTSLEQSFEGYKENYRPARVFVEHKGIYRLYTEEGEVLALISGKMKYQSTDREHFPAVGDWVVIDKHSNQMEQYIIHHILPRKSKFSRKIAGKRLDEQIIAVNVDTAFICMSLNNDFNLRRLERFLIAAWESGANPVVLLTKCDLCEDIEDKINQVAAAAPGVNIHTLSAHQNIGIEQVDSYVKEGETVVFLGSSGVGKSTLINYLLGEDYLATKEIRSDDGKGRHTTTHRELIVLPSGGIVIDTPGMREFQLLDNSQGLDDTFRDVEELIKLCKFTNCTHKKEPGCQIRLALEDGTLEQSRLDSFKKLQKEARFMQRKEIKNKLVSNKKGSSKSHRNVKIEEYLY